MTNTERSKALRILVIGSSCAGKSTLAIELAQTLGLPRIELDELFWGPNWTPKATDEFRALAGAAAADDDWIADGNYRAVRDLLWPRATTVIWLNYSLVTVLWRGLKRTLTRSLLRRELWHGNRESLRRAFFSKDSILLWIATTFYRRRREFATIRASGEFSHLLWVELRTPAATQRWLKAQQNSESSCPCQ